MRNRQALIPTVAQTEEGFYIDSGPVTVVELGDFSSFECALLAALGQDNPRIPTPAPADEPSSVILEKVGLKRWEAFERQAVLFTVFKSASAIFIYSTGRGLDGMWTQSGAEVKLPVDTSDSQIVESVWQELIKLPEMNKRRETLPMLLPPPATDS